MSLRPIFGEIEPCVLHEIADVAIDVGPIDLVRNNPGHVAESVVEEGISNEIVNISTMRNTWIISMRN